MDNNKLDTITNLFEKKLEVFGIAKKRNIFLVWLML